VSEKVQHIIQQVQLSTLFNYREEQLFSHTQSNQESLAACQSCRTELHVWWWPVQTW